MNTDRIHILVVDDLIDMADSTAQLLALWGYDATACSSGATALECVSSRRPAAVLLDLVMPRMSGFQFAQTLRGLPGCEAVPIIAVSGYWTPEYAARAWKVGIGHYLLKPAEPSRLKALLISVTESRVISSRLQVGVRRTPSRAPRRVTLHRPNESPTLLPMARSHRELRRRPPAQQVPRLVQCDE